MGWLGAMGIGYALASVATGMLSDKLGRRPMLLIATGGMAICYALAPHMHTITGLCIVAFFRGVATAFLWPPLMAWMTETSGLGSFSGLLGGYNVTWASGMLVGFLVGGYTYQHLGYEAPFYIASALATVSFFFVLLCTPEAGHLQMEAHEMKARDARAFVREGFLLITISQFVVTMVLYMFPKVVGAHMGEAEQGSLHVLRMAGQVVVFAIMARTTRWHFSRWPAWLFVISSSIGVLLLTLASGYLLYAAGFVCLGVGMGVAYMLSAYYALMLMESKGLGGGLQEMLLGVGGVAGPLYGGAIGQLSTARWGVGAGLLPMAGAAAYCLIVGRRLRTPGNTSDA